MPQLESVLCERGVKWEDISDGLFLLSVGLAKKILLADNLAPIVRHNFDVAAGLTFLEATFASVAYSLQLYFDFSGYSDMAVACALFFGFRLPWNFLSPYKARTVQEFWRRWHITLSFWLRDYLYIPLGGGRRGLPRTIANIFITFLLGGLWHGAAWTFVLWGGLHALALAGQRLWSRVARPLPGVLAWLLTLGFLNAAWTVFRVPDFSRLSVFFRAWTGKSGFGFDVTWREVMIEQTGFSSFTAVCLLLAVSAGVALWGRNSRELLQLPLLRRTWAAVALFSVSVLMLLFSRQSQDFIYVQF